MFDELSAQESMNIEFQCFGCACILKHNAGDAMIISRSDSRIDGKMRHHACNDQVFDAFLGKMCAKHWYRESCSGNVCEWMFHFLQGEEGHKTLRHECMEENAWHQVVLNMLDMNDRRI